ncbi:unnamed protein product [Oikopleura dioica]|uniref:Fibrinogen C-terminal domain-containing protein n=1 Tax=Oikopleura dioica TaxID=34765 RepID=E4YW20_OIKDI|nr:unnamed protein product [Oikopleura dioica]
MKLATALIAVVFADRERRAAGIDECKAACDEIAAYDYSDNGDGLETCLTECDQQFGTALNGPEDNEFLQCEVYEIDPFNFCCPSGIDVNEYWPVEKPAQRGHRPIAPGAECPTGCAIAKSIDEFVCAFYSRVSELETILVDLANALKTDLDGIMELRQKFVRRYREVSSKSQRSIQKITEIGETFIDIVKMGLENEDLIDEPKLFGGIKKDCADYYKQPFWTSSAADQTWNKLPQSGVYQIQPTRDIDPFFVYCDQKTAGGGWTLIQHNGISRKELWKEYSNGEKQLKTDWNRNWENYKAGFGHVASNGEADFWLGLERMHALTAPKKNGGKDQTLRIDLVDWEGEEFFGEYSKGVILSEKADFKLIVRDFSGVGGYSIGDALGEGMDFEGGAQKAFTKQNYMKFSTHDNDNDKLCMWSRNNMQTVYGKTVPKFSVHDEAARCGDVAKNFPDWEKQLATWGSCAQQDGAGFWYNRCSAGNLNGRVYGETGTGFYELKTISLEGGYEMMEKNHDDGLIWATLNRGRDYSFMMAEMRVRPKDFVGYSATAGLEMLRNGRTMDENKANKN